MFYAQTLGFFGKKIMEKLNFLFLIIISLQKKIRKSKDIMKIKKLLFFIICSISLQVLFAENLELRRVDGYNSKSSTELSISAAIEGNTLSITFQGNIGSAAVVVTTAAGTYVCGQSIAATPGNVQLNISNAGNYILTITLSNGDIYNANFFVQ